MRFQGSRSVAGAVLLSLSGLAYAGLDELDIKTDLHGAYVIGVMAHDQREYVVKGETPENVIGGYIKGILRTRAQVKTDTEEPLSDVVSEGLRKSFVKNKWFAAAAIPTALKDTDENLATLIKTAKLKRCLIVTVNDLWTESYRNTSVNYKFTIAVFDDQARKLAKSEATGVYDTGAWGGDAAAEILSQVMTDTLAKPEFATALRN
jgi:hypothetical protein